MAAAGCYAYSCFHSRHGGAASLARAHSMFTIQQAMLRAVHATQKPVALRLLYLAALLIIVAATWCWRAIWFGGPAPSYVAIANLTRYGQCGARLFDNDWYGAHVLALTNGAVFDVF